MSDSPARDPNYPDIAYPHRAAGYGWGPRFGRLPKPGLHGPEPAPELLLDVARAAYATREIRENFLAEARYPGEMLDDGKFPIHPIVAANMLDAFYAGHIQRHGRQRDYTLDGIWRLTELLRAWASGTMDPDDDAAALEWLRPAEAEPTPPGPGATLWIRLKWALIAVLLLLMGLVALDIVTPAQVLVPVFSAF